MARKLRLTPLQRDLLWTLEEAGEETLSTILVTLHPSDRDAFVQSCSATELNPPLSLPIVDAGAGFFIGAGTTKSTHVHSVYVGLEKRSARSLVGQQLNCTGLDWHGHPPP